MITSIDARNELTLLKTKSLPLKMVVSMWFPIGISFSRKSIFRCYVSFREGTFPFGSSNVEGNEFSIPQESDPIYMGVS